MITPTPVARNNDDNLFSPMDLLYWHKPYADLGEADEISLHRAVAAGVIVKLLDRNTFSNAYFLFKHWEFA